MVDIGEKDKILKTMKQAQTVKSHDWVHVQMQYFVLYPSHTKFTVYLIALKSLFKKKVAHETVFTSKQ